MIGIVASAPSSTAKKMPGRPRIQKKFRKFIPAWSASMIEVVSPTRVAAPCRFEETAIERIIPTGLIFSFRQMARPTGATMRTVATLSIKAEITPANRDIRMMTHITFFDLSRRISARSPGMPDSIKYSTMIMVPTIIIRTFQLIVPGSSRTGSTPETRKTPAAASAYTGRYFGFAIMRM